MKPALVIVAAVLLLAGCSSAKDPFVGTWQAIGYASGNGLVISKVAKGYVVVRTDSHRGVFRYLCLRHGDQLKAIGREANPGQPTKPFVFVDVFNLDPANGRLTWTEKEDGKRLLPRFVLTRLSGNTAIPTPIAPTTTTP